MSLGIIAIGVIGRYIDIRILYSLISAPKNRVSDELPFKNLWFDIGLIELKASIWPRWRSVWQKRFISDGGCVSQTDIVCYNKLMSSFLVLSSDTRQHRLVLAPPPEHIHIQTAQTLLNKSTGTHSQTGRKLSN